MWIRDFKCGTSNRCGVWRWSGDWVNSGTVVSKKGAALLEPMIAREDVCVRKLGETRAGEVRFGRFLANPKVTVERLIEGWSDRTALAVAGRDVLAIQDTTELSFRTSAERGRGLGETAKGHGRGLLLHAMLAVDAKAGVSLGLVGGQIWTRSGRVTKSHNRRPLTDKESRRWIATTDRAKTVLRAAASVTVIADRESDIYAQWAAGPGPNFHLLTRAFCDRRLAQGGTLFDAAKRFSASAQTAFIDLPARGPTRPARRAELSVRFGAVTIRCPKNSIERDLPPTAALYLVEVAEPRPPADIEPIHWRLLTTHRIADAAAAWQIVEWYKRRWVIEQLFRVLKTQGLKIEDSQIETADRLLKLAAIATKAAAITIQLVQGRDGRNAEIADLAFDQDEIATLEALNTKVQGKTALQKNPHRARSLAWAAWIIGRLGGWDGYPSSRRPGPITFRDGLQRFQGIVEGWKLKNVCIP